MRKEKNVIMDVNHVTTRFNLANRKTDSTKGYFIKITRREFMFQEFFVLKDISFQIKRGETWGLAGTNGSDKSILLKAIGGIIKPSKGSVTVNDSTVPLTELGAGFDGGPTARENIFLNGCLLGHGEKYVQDYLGEIVDFTELWDFPDSPIKNYSSSMRVRLEFAIAMMARPDVSIVGEVLVVGDFEFRQKCQARMNEMLSNGTTLLFIFHPISEVLELCDHAIWLDRGKTAVLREAEEVYNLCISK